jgi:hypothetical protein
MELHIWSASKKLNGRDHLEELGNNEKRISEWILS